MGYHEFFLNSGSLKSLMGVTIQDSWDISVSLKELAKARLCPEMYQYHKVMRKAILQQIHLHISNQIYLDILQARYGSTIGSFFFQTPALNADAMPYTSLNLRSSYFGFDNLVDIEDYEGPNFNMDRQNLYIDDYSTGLRTVNFSLHKKYYR